MADTVVRFPHVDLRRAREIVANPDLYSAREVVAACDVMFAHGGREDVRAVLALQRAGVVAGFESDAYAAGVARARRENRITLLGLVFLVAAAVGMVEILDWIAAFIGALM